MPGTLTVAARGTSVRRVEKPAQLIANAEGYDLAQLLAGRRPDEKPAPALWPAEIARRGGPSESSLSRCLKRGGQMTEENLARLAAVLFDRPKATAAQLREVRRAYSVTVRRMNPWVKDGS